MSDRLNEKDFWTIIESYSETVQEIALAARALIIEMLPEVFEVVWVKQGSAGYGTGPKKMSEHFTFFVLAKKHLSFGFYYGAELDDPDGLLEGTGKKLRHHKIRTVEDVDTPQLRAMITRAIGHHVPPPRPL